VSFVYRSETVYGLTMWALYGRHYGARDRVVAELVPPGAELLDVCCGPATLYRRRLREKGVRYRGLDLNPRFVVRLRALGIRADVWDAAEPAALPPADIVTMQASLYHFLPDPRPVLERMLAAARDVVIVSEPVRNLSDSRFAPLAAIGRQATRVGDGGAQRFDEPHLDALMGRYSDAVRERFLIPGGREKVYVLRGRRTDS
jgi:SAM-dependent methyltransferase